MKKVVLLMLLILTAGSVFARPILDNFNTLTFHGEDWDPEEIREDLEAEQARIAQANAAKRTKAIQFVLHGVQEAQKGNKSAWMDFEDALSLGLNLWAPAEELAQYTENGRAISPVRYAGEKGAFALVRQYGYYEPIERMPGYWNECDDDDDDCVETPKELPVLKAKAEMPGQNRLQLHTHTANANNAGANAGTEKPVAANKEKPNTPKPVELSAEEVKGLFAAKIRENKDNDDLQKLVATYNVDVNKADVVFGFEKDGDEFVPNTPLGYAAFHNADKSIKTLVALGADVNAKPKIARNTKADPALFVAIKYLNEPAVIALLENNAKVNVRDSKGHGAVLYASLLLERAADKSTQEKIYRLVETMLKSGAKPNSLSREKIEKRIEKALATDATKPHVERFAAVYAANPLMFAIMRQDMTLAKILLEAGANVNYALPKAGAYPNGYRMTPLMLAAEMENIQLTKLLVAQGADVEKTDKANRTALTYALRMDEANKLIKGDPSRLFNGLQEVAAKVKPGVIDPLYDKGARLHGEVPTQAIRNTYASMQRMKDGKDTNKMTTLIDMCDAATAGRQAVASALAGGVQGNEGTKAGTAKTKPAKSGRSNKNGSHKAGHNAKSSAKGAATTDSNRTVAGSGSRQASGPYATVSDGAPVYTKKGEWKPYW